MRITLQNGAVMAVLAALGLMPVVAADDYPLHARVSYDAGGSMVKGGSDDDWSHATVNALVLPGDTLWVDKGGTSELELAGGTFLRMADGSKVEVSSLPPSGVLRGWQGSFYVQRLSRSSGGMMFTTPACAVQIEPDTCVRFDIVDAGATTVSVRWGRASVSTDAGGTTLVTDNRRCWVDPGYLPSETQYFDRSEEDSFDVWNRERTQLLAGGGKTVPNTVVIQNSTMGASELASSGEWIYVDNSFYWRPTVVADYIPYRCGYWSYVPGCGSVWVDEYPFAYVTSHYGRWHYAPTYGWVWGYDPVWSPAWVATIRCGDYFVWTPVDYYSRPVAVYQSAYFSVGGVQFCVGATSYVPATYVYSSPFYVHPVYDDVVHYIGMHPTQINIWNINVNHRPQVRVPYDHSVTTVRDYSPHRSIRGPEYYREGGRAARESVTSLERSVGRAQFASVDRTGGHGSRTVDTSQGRMARMRSVRVEDKAVTPPALPMTRGQDRTARADMPARSGRETSRALSTPDNGRSDARSVRGPAQTPSGRDAGATRNSVGSTRIPGLERGKAEATQSIRNTPSRSDTGMRRTPTARLDMDVPEPTPTRKPEEIRTPVRSDSDRSSAPQQPRVTTPSRGSDTPARTPVPDRGNVRSNTPSMPAPSRGTSRPLSSSMTVPSRTVIRSTPSVESSPERSSARSTPSTDPQRSVIRSAPSAAPTPSRSVESFRAEPRVVQPTVQERRDIRSTPEPSRSRSFDAPQRSVAPAPQPSRSISAPSSSRSFSMPSGSRSSSSDSDSSRSLRGSGGSSRR